MAQTDAVTLAASSLIWGSSLLFPQAPIFTHTNSNTLYWMNFLSESVIRELASTIWVVLHVCTAHAHDPKIPLPVHTCCKSTVFAVFSSWIPLTHTFPIPMHTHAHTPSCRFWGDIDVDSLSTGWVFFSTTSKISSLPGILFSVFFFCLPVHSLSLSL